MLIKITGESVKFIVSKYILESLINMSLQMYISYIPEQTFTLHNSSCTSFITISQHLEFKVKIQKDPNDQITNTAESSLP